MTSKQSGSARGAECGADYGAQFATTLASLAVGAGFLALWFWLLPSWLGFERETAREVGWRRIAAVPSVLGFSVALRCIWDFGWTGRGTPAPIAPPQRLVVVGLYRYVRNPMYVGFITGWAGLWEILGRANGTALTVALVAVVGVALFVPLYEEPTLRKKFGAPYEEYCRNVPRRMRGVAYPLGERELLMRMHEQGVSLSALSRKSGIAREVLSRWWLRYKEQGRAGLEPRSRRPRRSPGQLTTQIEQQVLALRNRGWGPVRIAFALRIGHSKQLWFRSPIVRVCRRYWSTRGVSSLAGGHFSPSRRFPGSPQVRRA
jgi:protein-S-isoprenylcysteine O-methyltransferase Ste14